MNHSPSGLRGGSGTYSAQWAEQNRSADDVRTQGRPQALQGGISGRGSVTYIDSKNARFMGLFFTFELHPWSLGLSPCGGSDFRRRCRRTPATLALPCRPSSVGFACRKPDKPDADMAQ
jgi:hypothetical protein